MEQFIVSARKYRPSQFEEVVGQRAITNTLENAIKNNHLAQALLFTGPRGVGKTTCARILAKKINEDGSDQDHGDFAFNIFELDAASNNSVDDIRSLIDQVRIPPQIGKFKVYIIDEVHMLSQSAFNAFLKTLEEPPKHAIFILATTEKHKIIPTILSRCQIFDFRRITVNDIKEQLARVAQEEGINAEDDALQIIAQKADGAMRDALSIFDRVVTFSGKELTREAVTENLNVLDYTYYFKVTDLLLQNNIPEVLLAYDEILGKGFDGHHFIMGLAGHFRDLLVSQDAATVGLLEVGEGVKKMYLEQTAKTDKSFLLKAIQKSNDCDLKYKASQNQRLLVELCLMELASLTMEVEKKNSRAKRFVIPPSYFKQHAALTKAIEQPAVKPQAVGTPDPEPAPVPEPVEPIEVPVKASASPSLPNIKRKRKPSGLSIKSIEEAQKIKQEQSEKLPDHKNLPEEVFTEEAFHEAWKAYANKLEQKGKFNLLSHLTMGVPKLEGTLVHLVFPNDTIKVEVEREKGALLKAIRSELNNFKIDLSIEVDEQEVKRYAYTTREKFEKLREKNPLVEDLRQTFDLDL